MNERYSVQEYLNGPEMMRRQELEWGMVREAASPFFWHQSRVTRLAVILDSHVCARKLGLVVVAPIDVVLDAVHGLVVQPDLVFISAARVNIIHNQVWGAPDLVVEVLSPTTERRDRKDKLKWYRDYGVRECWLVDETSRRVEVHEFTGPNRVRHYGVRRRLSSSVFETLDLPVAEIFEV